MQAPKLTSQYALRAMMYLAQHEYAWPITGRRIAEESSIPMRYLSKVLGDLVRFGLLKSTRGKNGGFRMARNPKETTLFDVVSCFESMEKRPCPFGNEQCKKGHHCVAHDYWQELHDLEQRFFQETSIKDISTYLQPERE